jgi:hypothetical protein
MAFARIHQLLPVGQRSEKAVIFGIRDIHGKRMYGSVKVQTSLL